MTVNPEVAEQMAREKKAAEDSMTNAPCEACQELEALAKDEATRTFEPLPKPRLRRPEPLVREKGALARKGPMVRYSRNASSAARTCDDICYSDKPRCKCYREFPNLNGVGSKCDLFNLTGCDPPPTVDDDGLSSLERDRRKRAREAKAKAAAAEGAEDAAGSEVEKGAEDAADAENLAKDKLLGDEEEKLIRNTLRKDRMRSGRVEEDDYAFPGHFVKHARENKTYQKSLINAINAEYLAKHPE